MSANSGPPGHRVFAGVVAFLVCTALVTVAVAQTTQDVPPTEPDLPPLVELSDAQLERMLERLAARESVRLLDLNSYVVVVGRAPTLPLFGSKADLAAGTAALGMPTHAEMMAVVTPSPVTQAAGADTLGIVTATAFGVLAPLAVKTVAMAMTLTMTNRSLCGSPATHGRSRSAATWTVFRRFRFTEGASTPWLSRCALQSRIHKVSSSRLTGTRLACSTRASTT